MRSTSQSLYLALKLLQAYRKSSPICSCEERMGAQRGTKVAPRCSIAGAAVGEKVHFRTKRH